jgi:transcriptional regulator with XRE-family HTH domain
MKESKVFAEKVAAAGVDGRSQRKHREVHFTEPRVGWSGGLSPEEKPLRGATLLQWIIETANERGLQLNQVAAKLGCTYGYLHQLRKGMKPIPGISEQLIDACAEFLGIPRLAVMIAADIVKPTDFYADAEIALSSLDAALRLIRSDPEWGPRCSPAVMDLDNRGKLFVINLYEQARGVQLLPGRANIERYIQIMSEESERNLPANDM